MPTDTERREVARRLRGNATQDMTWVIPWAVFNDAAEHGTREVMERLAGLIEPPRQCPCYDSGKHRCSIHDVPTIDRDALIELADDLDYAGANVENVAYIDQTFHEAARRIREALGVEP